MNPWNLQAALFAKHAQHAVLIHFPIALFLAGVAFDLASAWTGRKDLANVAYWNLTVAVPGAAAAVITGVLAWQFEFEGRRVKGILLLHLLAASTAFVLIVTAWLVHFLRQRRPDSQDPHYRWLIEGAGVLAITLTGYLGGFLSGVNH